MIIKKKILPLIYSKKKISKTVLLEDASQDSSFDVTTRYGLKGPRIESQKGRVFPHTSRRALVPTQPTIQ